MESPNNPDSVVVLSGSHKIPKADVISGICAACQKEAAIHKYLGYDQPKRFHIVVQDNSFLVIDIKNDVIRGSCRTYDDAVTFGEELENEKEDG
ncbi:hypothetical protein FACS1894110_01990 [Spirochaetia bacterium]|nr:hypothetical protein FACS1894110_01990 [Spirochaetia bacterium]